MAILRLFNILDQPETDTDNNCTGVFTFIGCRASGWAAIHCKQKFFTTFVCRSLSNSTMDNTIYSMGSSGLSGNLTCPKGWLFIDMKCLKFIQYTHIEHASCRHAQYTCENEGGRMLSIGTLPQPKRVELVITDLARLIQSFGSSLGLKRHFTVEECAFMISGIPFKYDTNPSEISHIFHLLEMLLSMTVQRPLVLPLFEMSTETCFFLELGYLQSMSQHKSDDIHFKHKVYWGVKAIECHFEIADATTFVCERSPFKFNTNCAAGFFTCDDNTCILSVYVCDDIKDCLNSEDEYGCSKHNYTAHSLSNIKIHHGSRLICATNNSNTLIMYTHVHSLCDGLHTCDILNEDLCSYREVKPIHKVLRYLLNTNHDVPVNDINTEGQAALGFIRDPEHKTLELATRNASSSLLKHTPKGSFAMFPQNVNFSALDELSTHMLPCEEMKTDFAVYDYCIIHNKYPCVYRKYSQICRPVLCVGMFKCRDYGCIRLSSMCDGHVDCPSAEDEYSCFNISCPGLIKCRNENRCIGIEQMCDGVSDCIYSSDDEMTCNKCSVGCTCAGYAMQCDNMKTIIYELVGINHVKSLILKGDISTLYLTKSTYVELVSIDVSYCNIGSVISVIAKNNFRFSNVLHANFSNNYIKMDSFLFDAMFAKLSILDLGNNLFTILVNSSFTNLIEIKILQFDNNPINYITLPIFKKFPHLWILNIKNVYLLTCKLSTQKMHLNYSLHLITDDALFCCYFTSTMHCFTPVVLKCYGFINNLSRRIIIYMLILSACIIVVSNTAIYLYSLVRQGFKNALISVLLNIGFSEILACIYISCILAADWQDVNILYWQTGNICIIIQKILTLALLSNIILRFLAALVLLLKIVYPFKHQCRWLHYIWIVCGSIWFISIVYTLLISIQFFNSHSVFCTHWCQGVNKFLPLKISLSTIDLICVFGLIVCVIMTEKTLKKSMLTASGCQGKKAVRSPARIIFPLAVELCAEAIFRLLGACLILSEFSNQLNIDSFCNGIIYFILPVKSMISMSARHIKQMANKRLV